MLVLRLSRCAACYLVMLHCYQKSSPHSVQDPACMLPSSVALWLTAAVSATKGRLLLTINFLAGDTELFYFCLFLTQLPFGHNLYSTPCVCGSPCPHFSYQSNSVWCSLRPIRNQQWDVILELKLVQTGSLQIDREWCGVSSKREERKRNTTEWILLY